MTRNVMYIIDTYIFCSQILTECSCSVLRRCPRHCSACHMLSYDRLFQSVVEDVNCSVYNSHHSQVPVSEAVKVKRIWERDIVK